MHAWSTQSLSLVAFSGESGEGGKISSWGQKKQPCQLVCPLSFNVHVEPRPNNRVCRMIRGTLEYRWVHPDLDSSRGESTIMAVILGGLPGESILG